MKEGKIEKNNSPSLEEDAEIFLGQILYSDKTFRTIPKEIEEFVIKQIGRKYFYVETGNRRYKINKKTFKYENKSFSSLNFKLYRTKKELEDLKKKNILLQMLNEHFSFVGKGRNNSLEQLEKVVYILGLERIFNKILK